MTATICRALNCRAAPTNDGFCPACHDRLVEAQMTLRTMQREYAQEKKR